MKIFTNAGAVPGILTRTQRLGADPEPRTEADSDFQAERTVSQGCVPVGPWSPASIRGQGEPSEKTDIVQSVLSPLSGEPSSYGNVLFQKVICPQDSNKMDM